MIMLMKTLVGWNDEETYAGLSSRMSAVVERGSKSRFFLTPCLGDVGLPGPALPLFVSYS